MNRILFVNTRHFRGGGDSTYTLNLAHLLRNRGHEVAFFSMKDPRNIPDSNEDLFVEQIDFRELNGRKNLKDGFRVLSRVIYSPKSRKRFAWLLDRFNPCIIHLQNIHGHISPSVIFEARARKLPVVWTLHDYRLACPNSHYLIDSTQQVCEACGKGRYYHAIFKCCKKGSLLASSMSALEAYAHRVMEIREQVCFFLSPSGFLRKKLIENAGFSSEKVIHLPLFVPRETFANGGRDDGYLLFMGKLQTIKGVEALLEACRLVPEVRVVLAGRLEAPLAGVLDRLPPNACYVGMQHGEELSRLRCGARAIVLPSIWYENQPFTIIEAFAAGKPVIASDLGGMTELVKNGERGLLAPAGDARALAKAMKWMADHPLEAQRMGRQCRAYANEEHGAEAHYQRLMGIYSRVLSTKGEPKSWNVPS